MDQFVNEFVSKHCINVSSTLSIVKKMTERSFKKKNIYNIIVKMWLKVKQ